MQFQKLQTPDKTKRSKNKLNTFLKIQSRENNVTFFLSVNEVKGDVRYSGIHGTSNVGQRKLQNV